MDNIDYNAIMAKLKDMNAKAVASATGLSHHTVRKAAKGGDVTIKTLRALDDYFKGRGE